MTNYPCCFVKSIDRSIFFSFLNHTFTNLEDYTMETLHRLHNLVKAFVVTTIVIQKGSTDQYSIAIGKI